ncbi:MAG: hypothetical protein ACLQBD_16675 [Syntrophobacteraceae bacterium]|jgi:hypothetical protein
MTILLVLTVLIGLAGNFGAKRSGLCSPIISGIILRSAQLERVHLAVSYFSVRGRRR